MSLAYKVGLRRGFIGIDSPDNSFLPASISLFYLGQQRSGLKARRFPHGSSGLRKWMSKSKGPESLLLLPQSLYQSFPLVTNHWDESPWAQKIYKKQVNPRRVREKRLKARRRKSPNQVPLDSFHRRQKPQPRQKIVRKGGRLYSELQFQSFQSREGVQPSAEEELHLSG